MVAQPLAQLALLRGRRSVAMKIVSSPEIVPTTSGQRALSMATATLCAVPIVVLTTVSDGPAVRTSLHEVRDGRERLPACSASSTPGSDVAVAGLGDAELAQVAADARLRGVEALLAQQLHQLVLVVHGRLPDDPEDRRAARYGLMNFCCHRCSGLQ